jgi:hypothetical protein
MRIKKCLAVLALGLGFAGGVALGVDAASADTAPTSASISTALPDVQDAAKALPERRCHRVCRRVCVKKSHGRCVRWRKKCHWVCTPKKKHPYR